MTEDPIARLARANPVAKARRVDVPARLQSVLDSERGSTQPPNHPAESRKSRRLRRGVLAGVPVSVGACILIVVLLAGSSSSGVNVAAAAYAASAPYMTPPPAQGVVETVTMVHVLHGPNAGATLRQQEWVQTSARLRRELDTITGPGSQATRTRDWAFAPGTFEFWSSGGEAGVIHRIVRVPPTSFYPVHPGIDVEGQTLDGVEGIKRYRTLYSEGHIRLVGHVRHGGRLLWKLESTTGPPVTAQRERLVFLVDPHTFVPVIERQIDLALPGRPTIVETELLSYRVLAAASGAHAHKTLFDLASQHPTAKVLTGEPHLPPPPARDLARRARYSLPARQPARPPHR